MMVELEAQISISRISILVFYFGSKAVWMRKSLFGPIPYTYKFESPQPFGQAIKHIPTKQLILSPLNYVSFYTYYSKPKISKL